MTEATRTLPVRRAVGQGMRRDEPETEPIPSLRELRGEHPDPDMIHYAIMGGLVAAIVVIAILGLAVAVMLS